MASKKKMTREEAWAWCGARAKKDLPSVLACAIPPKKKSKSKKVKDRTSGEMADAADLGSVVERREGSSPSECTISNGEPTMSDFSQAAKNFIEKQEKIKDFQKQESELARLLRQMFDLGRISISNSKKKKKKK